ncbi:hypothetical protein [Nostoc sp. FACHB-888]|uniref:hypothetical protein n=1 Tax=Nostoc sp. FACHB-888 TaxID=2692842 RepID=UPI0016877943|nr:hypothetical protein [Nostoc sp. FACHB-888]MBD2246993.1 hypothetical protein [Nostoc sp. FACHB-888]MCC5653846.1 hypothetical protein [Nostoc sp. XA013]
MSLLPLILSNHPSLNIPQDSTLQQIQDVTPAIPHLAEMTNHLIQYISNEDLIGVFVGNA